MVAIAIFTIVMGGFVLLTSKVWSSNRTALEEAVATTGGSRTLISLTKKLREMGQGANGAYPIKDAKSYEMTVYIDDDNDGFTERVRYFLDNETLKKEVTKFVDGAYSDAEENKIVTTVLNYVTNITKNDPLFSYYGNGYPYEDGVLSSNPFPQDIKLIKIQLWVNIKPVVAPENINFESFVEPRNLNEY